MQAFQDFIVDVFSKLFFFIIGKFMAVCLSLAIFGILFETWLGKTGKLTFNLFPMTLEAQISLLALGYLALLHLCKFMYMWLQADSGMKVYYEYPEGLCSSIGYVTVGFMFAYSLPLVAWAMVGEKYPNTNYFFIALIILGIVASFFHGNYGYSQVSKRSNVRAPISREENQQVYEEVARHESSTITFADILGNAAIKRRLLDAARAITAPKADTASKRNGILLFGEPGNGKTVFAEALAGELKLPILKLTHSDVASQWVGARTEKIKAAFDQAVRSQPCVFFIDEIDSFLPDRSSTATQTKEDTDVVNSLLTLLVDIRKHKVVVMAATNYMDRLDGAAVREGRFDFKVEITPPDEEARIGLLTSGLKKNLKKINADAATIKNVAQRWNGFSVKRILAVTEELPSYVADLQAAGSTKNTLEYEDFMAALRLIQGRKGASPENVKPMSELILPEVTKEALDMLSSRMRDPQRVERMGGTLPTGVLFFGPPGTGKTAACKALAKEVNWAYLIATGTDLARDPKALEKLYAQAKEIRPCIVFIDEADDLVRNREYASNSESTNKLLTLMDGVNDRVRDVVWIAATNHPDQIDPALLRGGRFTEKVEFVRPNEDQLSSHVDKWLQARKVQLARGFTADMVAAMVGDESIANLEAVMQYAVNRAISKSSSDHALELSEEDMKRGVTMVLGVAC
jgi:transitional endoplasmic reticulum ATPase